MKACVLLIAAFVSPVALAGEPAPTPAAPTAAARAAQTPTAPVPYIGQDALLARQARHDASLFVLDVRGAEEFAQGHVPGAANIPHDQVASRLAEIPKDKDVVLYCRSGRRTALAVEALEAHGYTRLLHLEGDMTAWMEKSRPIETGAATGAPRP
jgi:rhodanese-related sulfurtransferase